MSAHSSEIFIGNGPEMLAIKEFARKVARSKCNVLITGETGTGKELVARLVHSLSPRNQAPLVSLNCAAVPDTLLETELFGHEKGAFTGAWRRSEGRMSEANGGTLFLDEIGEMSLGAQAKVLRSVETGQIQRPGARGTSPIDIRVFAATNQNLEAMVEEGKFRRDLYFRLNVARIALPPLRERRGDILELADHFLRLQAMSLTRAPLGFSRPVQNALRRHEWPGNARELRNVVEVAMIHEPYPLVELEHIPASIGAESNSPERGNRPADRTRILEALRFTNWNKSEAAKKLHWSRMTLYRKMARYSIREEPNEMSEPS
jgi:DNA-binding NtrC family response regulator